MSLRLRFTCAVLMLTTMQTVSSKESTSAFSFGASGCGNCGWFVVVDGVMGGLSSGVLESSETGLALSGSISLANNGGFSSIRTRYQRFDLSKSSEVLIRYRAKGQKFALTLNNYRRFWQPQFKTFLPETNGEWVEKIIPFSSFAKMRFDSVLGSGPTERELANIIRLGLISSDKKEGKFIFEVSDIKFR